MQTTKQLQRFYVVEVFRPQPPIPGSQGSETVSLPYGTSAFGQRQYTTRVNRARVEGTSPSTCARGLNDFLLFQAYRLWMEYPSREKDENYGSKKTQPSQLIAVGRGGSDRGHGNR